MPGFGNDPFGHYPFGNPGAAVTTVTPGALSAVLSTQPSVLDGLLEHPVPFTLLLTAGGDATVGVGLSPTPASLLLTIAAPTALTFTGTVAPGSLIGVLSLGAWTVDSYPDTVIRTPAAQVLTLSVLGPTVGAFDTTLEVQPLSLSLAIVPPAQPVDFTQMRPTALTGLLSLPVRDLPVSAGWILPSPLSALLVTGGAPTQAFTFIPQPLVLTLSIPRYFVFSGLPYSVSQVQVYEPWEAEPAIGQAWAMVTEAGLPWAVRGRAAGGWELVVIVREPWRIHGRNP